MKAKIIVKRFNKKKRGEYEEFEVELEKNATVLDALNEIQQEIDSSLAFRKNCRRGACGGCAMRINGAPKLACETRAEKELKANGRIVVEPLSEEKIIKDLVVDEKVFWEKIEAVKPWIVCGEKKNLSMNREQVENLSNVSDCIYCGICCETCKAAKVDSNYLGPAALALCFKLAADPRDEATKQRLEKAVDGGLWNCTRAFNCVQNCPKNVEPATAIEKLRSLSLKQGMTKSRGAKYSKAFAETVEKTGKLDVARVAIRTLGWSKLKEKISLIIRLLSHGKLPFPRMQATSKVESVKRLFKKEEGG